MRSDRVSLSDVPGDHHRVETVAQPAGGELGPLYVRRPVGQEAETEVGPKRRQGRVDTRTQPVSQPLEGPVGHLRPFGEVVVGDSKVLEGATPDVASVPRDPCPERIEARVTTFEVGPKEANPSAAQAGQYGPALQSVRAVAKMTSPARPDSTPSSSTTLRNDALATSSSKISVSSRSKTTASRVTGQG